MDSSSGPLDLVLHDRPIDLSPIPSPLSNQTLIWSISTFEAFFDLSGMGQVQDRQEVITLHYPSGLTVIIQVTNSD